MKSEISLETLMVRIEGLEARMAEVERSQNSKPTAGAKASNSKKLSAKEFLLTKNVGSELQRVAALAFYLEREEGVSSFNVADLEAAFRSAREKLPKNMNDAVNKNIARGFFMQAAEKKDSKKAWQLTATGERFVETEMNK